MSGDPISYRKAGVDIEAGDRFASGIASIAKRAHRPEVLSGIGGFAGLFRLNTTEMAEPVLVSGTDGVGTKLLIAQRAGCHDTIGIDLVAMCVNDVLTIGAEPLFFLDYYATGRLEPGVGKQVLDGIVTGCEQAGCALLGGETAEMPGMYPDGKYDLAGFCVGVVDRPKIVDGSRIAAGDAVLGVASSGLHSNGFSLVRHVLFEHHDIALDAQPDELDATLAEVLLRPTRIYAKAVKAIVGKHDIHGLAHITGGGLMGNIQRVVPEGLIAQIERGSWDEPGIFQLMRRLGVPDAEMDAAFNLGLGLTVVCPDSEADAVMSSLREAGETVWRVGTIGAG